MCGLRSGFPPDFFGGESPPSELAGVEDATPSEECSLGMSCSAISGWTGGLLNGSLGINSPHCSPY